MKSDVSSGTVLEIGIGQVRYGSSTVLKVEANVTVGSGEIILVEGANGTGKTSLLRAVAGVRGASFVGEILLDGHSLLALGRDSRVQSGVRMLPQGRRLFERLTAEEHEWLASSWLVKSRAFRFRGLSLRRNRKASTLSGGQARLCLLRALTAERSKVLLADEPFVGLDKASSAEVLDLLEEHLSKGSACLLVDHTGEGRRQLRFASVFSIDVSGFWPSLRVASDGGSVR